MKRTSITRGGCDFFDMGQGAFFFDNHDGHGVAVGKGSVAIRGWPAEGGEARAVASLALRRIFGGRRSLTRKLRCGSEREDDADCAHIQGTLGSPELVDRDAHEWHGLEATSCEDHIAGSFERCA